MLTYTTNNSALKYRSEIKTDKFLKYWAILMFIIFSGSAYFQVLRIRLTMVLVGVTILLMIASGWKIRKINLIYIFVYLVAVLLNIVFTYSNGVDWNDFILLVLRFSFLIILQSNMTEIEYKKIFINIMVFEAALSLVCFLYTDVLDLGTLPLYDVEDYNGIEILVTPYYTVGWSNVGFFHRNAGWFSEPGSHQIFLNFAILFLLADGDSCGYSQIRYWLNFFILAVTLLTTQSTTGYMCFLVIMCAMMFIKKGKSRNVSKLSRRLRIVALIALILLLIVESVTHVIEDKFAGMFNGQSSASTRYNDTVVSYMLAFSKPLFGYGLFNTVTTDLLASYNVVNNSNGLGGFLMGSGLIIGIMLLVLTYRGLKKSMPYGTIFNILVFVFYLLCVNSEGGVVAILMYLTYLFKWKPEKQVKGIGTI